MPARSVLIATVSAVALIGSLGWHRTKVQPIPVATLPVAAASSIALPTSSDQPRTRDGRHAVPHQPRAQLLRRAGAHLVAS